MNHKQLVLFFVTFYASGSFYVQGLSVEEAKNAMETAMIMLQTADRKVNTDYDSPIILDSTQVKVHCFFRGPKLFNCGIEPRHTFFITEAEAENVKLWFEKDQEVLQYIQEPKCLDVETKDYSGQFINCLGTYGTIKFNYHLELPGITIPKAAKFLNMLLSRLLHS